MLAYGSSNDAQDDYICMAESTSMECMYRFCKAVVAVFGSNYMRTPNEEDTAGILAQNEARGLGSLVALITCIRNVRTVRLLGRTCTKVTKEIAY
jgi:hypothetical protein